MARDIEFVHEEFVGIGIFRYSNSTFRSLIFETFRFFRSYTHVTYVYCIFCYLNFSLIHILNHIYSRFVSYSITRLTPTMSLIIFYLLNSLSGQNFARNFPGLVVGNY